MLSMAIHHNVWLNRDQRYAIHDGIEIVTIGVSVPVWVANDKTTSEPAKEIFCKYYIKNTKIDYPIQIMNDGYEIVIPYRESNIPSMPDDRWRHLNFNEPHKLRAYYNSFPKEISSKNLLDLKDGGCNCLNFREHNKLKKDNDAINFIHFVNLHDINDLNGSLI